MANMRNSKKPNCRAKARARRPAVAPEAGVGPHRTLDAATLEFRPALPSDAAACVEIRAKTRENAVSAERLACMGITAESWGDDIAAGALRGHICTLDGAIVAYCFGERDTGEVVVLALLPRFEQLGLGMTLLAQVNCAAHRPSPRGAPVPAVACLIHAMHSKIVLCQIDANGYDNHDFPSSGELMMKCLTSPSWHAVAENRKSQDARLAGDGEVPFIR